MSNPSVDAPTEKIFEAEHTEIKANTHYALNYSANPSVHVNGYGWFAVTGYDYIIGNARGDVSGSTVYIQYSHDGDTDAAGDISCVTPTFQEAYPMALMTDAYDQATQFYSTEFKSDITNEYARVIYANGSTVASDFNICVMKVSV